MLYPGIVLLHSSEWAEEAGDVEDKGGGGGEGENRQRKVVEHYFPCGLCVYSAEKLVELAVADQRQRLYFAELNDDLDRMLACAKEHGLRPYANMTLIIVGLDGSITKFLRKQAGNSRDGVHTKASVSVAVDEALSSLLIDRKISTHHVADTAEMARYVQHFHESFDTSQTDKPLTHLDGVNKGKMFKLKEGNKTEGEKSREIWANQLVKFNRVTEDASKAVATGALTSCPLHVYNFITYGNIEGTGIGNPSEQQRLQRCEFLQSTLKNEGLKYWKLIGAALGPLFSPDSDPAPESDQE